MPWARARAHGPPMGGGRGAGGAGAAEGPGGGLRGAQPMGGPWDRARAHGMGRRMHSAAECIQRQYAIKAECKQGRMQSRPNAIKAECNQ